MFDAFIGFGFLVNFTLAMIEVSKDFMHKFKVLFAKMRQLRKKNSDLRNTLFK